MIQAIASFAVVALALISFLDVMRARANKRLKIKLRRALLDCLAFYKIEEALCGTIANTPHPPDTVLAVRRNFRALLRAQGFDLSEYATPQRLQRDIEKLS